MKSQRRAWIDSAIGKKFGRLTIIGFVPSINGEDRLAIANCSCGNKVTVPPYRIKNNQTKSCGCWKKESGIIHGMSKTSIYSLWRMMVARCKSPACKSWKNYGGRGIKVCERWLEFSNFYEDMGDKPPGMSLDRIDNNGDYNPSNCRWATARQQANNTRRNRIITIDGVSLTITEWATKLGGSCSAIYYRLCNGWDVKSAVTTPVKKALLARMERHDITP